jgi:hypothetical protein
MQLATATLEQRFVGSILDQSVLEGVVRLGRNAASVNQFRVLELREGRSQVIFGDGRDCKQQIVRKFTLYDRRDLRDFFGRPRRSSRAISESCSVAGISRRAGLA